MGALDKLLNFGIPPQTLVRQYIQKLEEQLLKCNISRDNKDDVTISMRPFDSSILDGCDEVPLDSLGQEELLEMLSAVVGESCSLELLAKTYSGLLTCNVPISTLAKAKNGGGTLRGFVVDESGKISQHGKFSEVGIGVASPLIVFQVLSFVTGQYYLHRIDEKLGSIKSQLDIIKTMIVAEDCSFCEVYYNRLLDLFNQDKYKEFDLQTLERISDYMSHLSIKYEKLVRSIIPYSLKIDEFQEKFFEYSNYMQIIRVSEFLRCVADLLLVKVAVVLGCEDERNYSKRLNFELWKKYEPMHRSFMVYFLCALDNKFFPFEDELISIFTERLVETEVNCRILESEINKPLKLIVSKEEGGQPKLYIPKAIELPE